MFEVDSCSDYEFKFNEACVIFQSKLQDVLYLFANTLSCELCSFSKLSNISNEKNSSFVINSNEIYQWRLFTTSYDEENSKLSTDKRNLTCEVSKKMGPNGIYKVGIDELNACEIEVIRKPSNLYTPLIVISGVLISIFLLTHLIKFLLKNCKKKKDAQENENDKEQVKRRVKSIDTFRGMSISMMIFVNNGAGGYSFLNHAVWNGLNVGDLVFPTFLWIMGFCIPISLTSQLSREKNRFIICKNIIQRSCILFFLGICLNTIGTESQLESIRIFGVLQRFGIAYLAVGLIYIAFTKTNSNKAVNGFLAHLNDCYELAYQFVFILIILIVHLVITFALEVPGCPKGYLGPGGLSNDGKYFNCTGGAAGYIDRLILTERHLYQHAEVDDTYKSGPFDPEGILGCLTTIVQTFLGVHAGKILRTYRDSKDRVVRWIIWALIYSSLGAALHFSNIIPVNKNLWSISFVFVTTSFSLVLFTLCYLMIDCYQVWNGGPFRVPGMNALVMFLGHHLCYQIFPFHLKIGLMNSHWLQTTSALWDVILWTIIAYVLHRKRIYITI